MECTQAFFTNGKAGNPNQRRTTDTAVGGKKRKKHTGSSALCPAGEPMVRCLALGSPYSKPSTAEDGLPQPGKAAELPPGYSIASIDAARKFMQRGARARSRPKTRLAAAWQEVQHAQVPERCGKRSRDGSNARSELGTASAEGARVFQRNHGGENGTLAVRCIPGNEILERTVPTTVEQEETRLTSRGQSLYCKPWGEGNETDPRRVLLGHGEQNGEVIGGPERHGGPSRNGRTPVARWGGQECPPYTKVRRFC